jgi:hypothetical protein
MNPSEVIDAWRVTLAGRAPSISVEITKEFPLRCPGCYTFDPAQLGGTVQLRELSDFKGGELVRRVLALVDRHKPLHVSLVGGDLPARYREVEQLLPQLEARGCHTQLVTSAFRMIPTAWSRYKHLNVVISVDGLPAEHDEWREPASITPCQFGGDPDCEQCGCIASIGLAAVGHHRVLGPLTADHIFDGSERVGRLWKRLSKKEISEVEAIERSTFKIL